MKLGLVIDLDTCVGCHACAVACKQWNTSGTSGPLTDSDPYGAAPSGVWFNRIRHYEIDDHPNSKTVNVPMSCMHCEEAACVTVCPTGASYKRETDGVVLVDQSKCMGCNLCAWACPYGARELDAASGVMKKCTLCVDRIYDEALPPEDRQPACVLTCPTHARFFGDLDDPDSEVSTLVRERGGQSMMPELGYAPLNKYLPPRSRPPAPVVEKRRDDIVAGGVADLVGTWMRRQKEAFERFGRAEGDAKLDASGSGRTGARGSGPGGTACGFGDGSRGTAAGTAGRFVYFHWIGQPAGPTINTALGFTRATVRLFDIGHASDTFHTREFGFEVARARLLWMRVASILLSFALPLALVAGLFGEPGVARLAAAVLSAYAGVFLERWLFFAEARHVVNLYHGMQRT